MFNLGTFLLLLMALLRTPLFVVLAAIALLGFYSNEVPLSVIGIEIYRMADMPMLIALPLFGFAGLLLAESGAAKRLVALVDVFLGWMPGGLPIIALLTCSFFTAFTGATGMTIVAVGALLYPALRQAGHSESFSLGLITSSGSLGLLLAPSMPLILYGIVAQQMSVGPSFELSELFIAGLTPMLLMLVCLSAYAIFKSRGLVSGQKTFSGAAARQALWDARWELPLPLVLLGGIYGGVFTLSEAAAVTAAYVLLVETFLYRDVPWHRLPELIVKSSVMVGGILMILAVSLALTNVMVDAEVPSRIFEWARQYIDNKLLFLLLLNLLLLFLGAFLDIFSALVLMVPLILPVAVSFGIHPIHLGLIFLANMQLGYFTPPVGMNLFIASYRFNAPIGQLTKATLPFFGVLLLVLLLITFVPEISLWTLE